MNIDEMQAGREMDALIAERVFGNTDKDYPHYSTNIIDAWQVAEQIQLVKAQGRNKVRFEIYRYGNTGPVKVTFSLKPTRLFWVMALADTAPLAICQAALKAVGA